MTDIVHDIRLGVMLDGGMYPTRTYNVVLSSLWRYPYSSQDRKPSTMSSKKLGSLLLFISLLLIQSELLEFEKPFKDDPAKQERFEQFIKEKYKGGLRSASSSLAGNMSEAARAQERLSFEAAADAIEKQKQSRGSKISIPSSMDFITGGVMEFTSGAIEV